MVKRVHIDPWFQLVIQNAQWKKCHPKQHILDARDLQSQLRLLRKEYMGSGLSLELFVREDNKPIEGAVRLLSDYLSERAALFMKEPGWTDYLYHFFYYTIQLYAHGTIGEDSFDDLIQMAEAHERDRTILPTICRMDLPSDLADDCQDWVNENGIVPNDMTNCVAASVGVLLGVLPDPVINPLEEE